MKDHPALAALGRATVSKVFRHFAWKSFPGLKKNDNYWPLFCYLLFGSWNDEDTSRLLLCAEILSAIEGRDPANSRAEKFLIRFRDEVLRPAGGDIQWTKPYHGKCRQLEKRYFGKEFEELFRQEHLGKWNAGGRVYLLDGFSCNRSSMRLIRREQREEAERLPALCPDAELIRTYMNTLKSNLFTKQIRRNFTSALKAVFNLPESPVKDAQLRILRHIHSQPQPFYFPTNTGHTVRLYSREAIPNLKGNVRRALTKGWEEADLRSSQFAICASRWQVPELLGFLQTRKSLWTHLLNYLNIANEQRELAKPILKQFLYAACFGMKRYRLKGQAAYWLSCAGLDTHLFEDLQQEPLIVALLNARDEALQSIADNGGAENCYGVWHPVTKERQPKHIMADIAQAWEMKLIVPAFELAQQTRDFTIALFQHDGFSVHATRRWDAWKVKIGRAINENATKLGFITCLEWS